MSPSFAAWYNVVLPFLAGHAKIAFTRRFVPESFLKTLAAERITLAPLVPTLWRMALAAGPQEYDLSALRAAMFSGEPGMKRDIEALAARVCRRVIGAYLSSEGACASAVVADERDLILDGKPECAGRPIAGADLRIVDPAGSVEDELPAGAVGEIVLRSASVAAGYWQDEAVTRQRFVDGWWRSGDLGLQDETGTVFVKGRLDNIINTGGVKVHAEEVEAALMRCPAVRQTAVIGVADERWGERIEAFVVPAEPNASIEAVLTFCRDNGLLAPAKLPKAIRFVEALPTGPTGKLSRAALRASDSG